MQLIKAIPLRLRIIKNANVPVGDIPDLVVQAIKKKTFTTKNALSLFRKSGLFPFNPDNVKVTDMPCKNKASKETNEVGVVQI